MALEEISSSPAIVVPVLLVAIFVYGIFGSSRLPDLPIVGAKPGEWFPLMRARWRNRRDTKTAILFAYSNYRHQTCILPVAGINDHVLLPASEFRWLIRQPESEVNYCVEEEDQLNHVLFRNQRLLYTFIRNRLTPTVLTKEIYNLFPALLDEIRYTVDSLLGIDTENFHEICVHNMVHKVSCQVMNRAFVGQSLSRNAEFHNAAIAYVANIPTVVKLIRFTWRPLRTLVALFLALPTRIRMWRIYDILGPEIERRLTALEVSSVDPELKATENDFLQRMVDDTKLSSDPHRFKFDMLFGNILGFNVSAMSTVSGTMMHAIVDLAHSKDEYLDELRVEIASVIAKRGGRFDKQALASMVKLDSTMRESQRMNTILTVSVPRFVVKKGGIETPSGIRVPQGAAVAVPTYAMMHDAAIYPDPYTFKPFRFAGEPAAPDWGDGNINTQGSLPQAWVKGSPEYVGFGYGPHACPGRHIAAAGVKLTMAYIIAHYDFDIQGRRPKNNWSGTVRLGPQRTTVRIRRRKEKDISFT
ncbi:cytochrome P450 [Daldinia decipiens]|uniref:cytochrome P450 n=1 Tax=Daldinia decipiens TaxID=326647 RepID=UPI0020C4A493|nr:cytochrome P450 [Daldinia decipiens]KAI1659022.1 cytochrome P450 [Daldinia decipiens]